MPLMTPNSRKAFQEIRTMTPSLHKAKFSNSLEPSASNEEVALVQGLTCWEKSKFQLTSAKVIQTAQLFLENRKNKRVCTDDLIKAKKNPITTRSNIASPVFHHTAKDPFDLQKDFWEFNKQFESEIHSALNLQSSSLASLVDQRSKIRAELINQREGLRNAQKDIEIHKNSLKKLEKTTKYKRKKHTLVEVVRKNSLKQEIFQKESKCAELELELNILINKNTKILESLDEKCVLVRREIDLLRETLGKHYKNSLKDGKDPRNEGVQWIVKALWDLGLKVSQSDFPEFCDSEIKDVILKLAEKTKDFEGVLKFRSENKPKRFHFVSSSQEKLNQIHFRLSQASKKIRVKQPKVQFINYKKRVTWTDMIPENIQEPLEPSLKPISKPSDLLQEIECLKKSGLSHLFQTFHNSKQYGKFNLSLILSSFLGIEGAKAHLIDFSKQKRFKPSSFSISSLST